MKTKIAVMSLCFTTLMYLVLSVSVSGLLAAFPTVPANTVMLVLTLPNLVGIAGVLATPVLAARFSRKTLSVWSLLLLLAGGAMCLLFHDSLPMLLAASTLMGLSYGLVSALFPLLVNANFSGEERITVMGLCSAMLQGGRLVTYLIGGVLAKDHWYDVYDTYLFAAAALVLVVVLLPKDRPSASRSGADSASLRSGSVWRLALFSMAFACLYFLISTGSSLYIEGGGLGTPVLTGWLSSMFCGVSGIAAALYGRLHRLTGRFTISIAFGLVGAGFLFAGRGVSLAGIVTAFLTSALAIALFTPWLMTAISDAAGTSDAPTATAVVLTCVNLGYFISPYVTGPLGSLLGGGCAAPFAAAGAASVLLCAVTAFLCRRRLFT